MADIKFNPRTLILVLFIVLMGLSRVLLPMLGDVWTLANYSAVGAIALFGGAYFSNNLKSFTFPIFTLFLGDALLSLTVYKSYNQGVLYEGWYWVYGAFALMVLAGKLIMKKVTIRSFLAASFAAVFIHWIVTDFGIWYGSAFYPQTLAEFWIVLVKAIPFELRLLGATLGYGAVMFGLFERLTIKFPGLAMKRSTSTVVA